MNRKRIEGNQERKKKRNMKKESEKGKEEFFQIMSFLCRQAKGWWLNLQITLFLFYSYFYSRQVCFDLITCVPFCLHFKMLLRWSEWRPGIIETFKCSQTPTPSVFQFSRSVMPNSLRAHELQHTRPPCPSPTPGVHSNSCPSSRWCHLAISSFRPVLLLPPIPPSIRVFSNESTLHMRWPKYWSVSFSISLSKEPPGLIVFRMDWLDLLADQGTLKRLLQHHSSKASILRCSAFFTVQLSYPYMTTGKP